MTQKWKSATAAFAVTTMLLGIGSQAFAASPEMILKNAENPSKEQVKLPARAVEIVAALEKLEPALKALTLREVVISDYDENQVDLYISHPDDTEMSAYLLFDRQSGELLGYEASPFIWEENEKVTDEAIVQKAEKAVQELFGEKKRKMTDAPQLSKTVYDEEELFIYPNVYFPILLNGLEIDEARYGIEVEMDSGGHLLGLSFQPLDLTGIQVADPKKAVTKEEIRKQIFTPERLRYGYVWEGTDGKPGIEYTMRTAPVFDALTGKQIEMEWGADEGDGKLHTSDIKDISLKPQGKPFIAKDATDQQILENLFEVDTKKLYTTYRKDEQQGEITYDWSNPIDFNRASIMVNKVTGDIGGYVNLAHIENLSVPLTKEQSLQKAITFLEPHAKKAEWQVEMYEEIKKEDKKSVEQYGFLFFEKQNGIPLMEYSYGVAIDPNKGQVVEFVASVPAEDRKYPVLKPSVTAQQAADIVSKQVPVKLTYIWPRSGEKNAPILVYKLDTSKGWPTVDAVNGSFKWGEYED
ncbi:hypothetical protein HP570_20260 [Brevibacillus sp. RS1.1]|uniref:YcdB/YcdC domain-containing protein n=1 Tax=Brevibacillus sp. RS1.1 TaxID=2738982 RepID=UPI00156B3EEA|nr:YcdB/YcdC domain-containing protein [Brevibacillus sp. RS1.1]NRR04551.1 hypothetical protein [Brevibacillus sp. RS1.1]